MEKEILKRIISGIKLVLLLSSMLALGLSGALSGKTNVAVIQERNGNLTSSDFVRASKDYIRRQNMLHGANLKDACWTLRRQWSEAGNKYASKGSLSAREIETSRPDLASAYAWKFGDVMNCGDFGYIDEGSTEVVIGIDSTRQNNYYELVDSVLNNGGELIDSVSIGNTIRAVVADVPFSTQYSFSTEVETTGLATYIEPNLQYEIDFVPNDPDLPKQWGFNKIEAEWAWNTTVGSKDVLVAVVDTGIYYAHPDLAANYVRLGYDWVNNDPDPLDDHGHGTHCAGVVAAVINNSIGIAGLAQVRIMAEKALDENGSGWSDDLARAIVHAVDQGADIISCSWGNYIESTLLHEAVRYAYDHGVLVVAAAGNDAVDIKHYPSAFDEVVAVAATDESDNLATFSNYGDWVDVAAPGVHIYSTVLDDAYAYMSGTSMATPHVSAIAALIWSQFPYMTRDQVQAQIQYTADDLGLPKFDVYYGYGRVNARKAVEQAPPDHDVLVLKLNIPSYIRIGSTAVVNVTILNMGVNSESAICVKLLANGSVVDSHTVGFLVSGASTSVCCSWTPSIQGVYNITSYVLPLTGETIVGNNALSAQVMIRIPRFIKVPQDYARIQDAVNAAFAGDTVYVASRTYYENIVIAKDGLTLVGEDQKNTIIDGQKSVDVILVEANYVNISGFTLQNSRASLMYAGIFVWASEGVTIINTKTINNFHGIILYQSRSATLRNDNMTCNTYNFGVDGECLGDFIHDIDTSNTVQGKPLYYLVNEHDKQVPSEAGYVAAVNSTNIVVKDMNLTRNFEGVLFVCTVNSFMENVSALYNRFGTYFAYSRGNTVQSSIATNNSIGIYLCESEGNNIGDNVLMKNEECIDLYRSKDNSIGSNKLLNSNLGVFVEKSNNNMISNNEASNNTYGLYLEKSSGNTLRDNNLTGNKYNFGVEGGYLIHFIHDVDASNTVNGKPIYYLINQKDLVVNTSTFPDVGYLGIVNSSNININSLTVTNNVQGMLFVCVNNVTMANINATDNICGILMVESFWNTVLQSIISNNKCNIELRYSNRNTINGNTLSWGSTGICLKGSDENGISGNKIMRNNEDGFWLLNSNSNNIANNTMLTNGYGMELHYSGGNFLRNNSMESNSYSLVVLGLFLPDFIQDIDTSNTVNRKPIYYWVNQYNKQIPINAGYVAVVNSTCIMVRDLSLVNDEQGVLFAYTTNSTIMNVTASGNYNGICLWDSDNNIICGNNVTENWWDGIGLYYSNGNTIADNLLSDNCIAIDITISHHNTIDSNVAERNIIGIYPYYSDNNVVVGNEVLSDERGVAGIALTEATGNMISRNVAANNVMIIGVGIHLEYSSNNNTIAHNTLSNNNYGISLGFWSLQGFEDQSNNNTIYHNSFIRNTKQVLSLDSTNTWDDGYPSGGNYWSDYAGIDVNSGPEQDSLGGDGIGDTPYSIDENNTDRYPLMKPWTPPAGHNVAIISIVPYKNVIGGNYSITINIYAANRGEYAERFNVTLYANVFTIASQTVTLESGTYANLSATWNVAGWPKWSYTIGAVAETVPDENVTQDNRVNVWIVVTIPGDANGDFKVEGKDVALVAKAYDTWRRHPRWDSNADLNCDFRVEGKDVAIVAKYYNTHYP